MSAPDGIAPSSDLYALWDGAYLIGALSPQDRSAYAAHLQTCPACAASVRDLAGLPGLLARVPNDVANGADQVRDAGEPPETILPSLLEHVAGEGRRTRRRLRLVAIGVAAALLVAVGIGVALRRGSGGADDRPIAFRSLTSASVTATAALHPVAWGTRIDLRCAWGAAPRAGASTPRYGRLSYALVVRDKTGRTQQVATWNAVAGRTTRVEAATSVPSSQIDTLEVQTSAGTPILRLHT